ncbi:hypothetical protein CLV80_101383 [Yoonia maritima]|uniref:Uncharacterized protein n=1 Tax=Yoonia maritima TaxID=1435347 RepID=A0A2T0W4W4_9RHOB|nr:hypothetical protein [Yoonia maritima]PRY80528.1 hypothetical protein CLV80_101383 [Yoonia maritima]
MTLTMDQMGQNPAFERFLSATVGEDVNGINISVLSMLARLEVDPWTEASNLAAMPNGPARKRLDTLMTRFKDVPTLGRDQGKVISALLDLLPRKRTATTARPADEQIDLPALAMRVPIYGYIIAFLILGWIINLALGQ